MVHEDIDEERRKDKNNRLLCVDRHGSYAGKSECFKPTLPLPPLHHSLIEVYRQEGHG